MGSASALHLSFRDHVHNLNAGQKDPGRKVLNPSMGRVRRLIARWSCSTRLLRYLDWRTLMGASRSALMASSAARLAPLLSMVTVSGTPFWVINFSK